VQGSGVPKPPLLGPLEPVAASAVAASVVAASVVASPSVVAPSVVASPSVAAASVVSVDADSVVASPSVVAASVHINVHTKIRRLQKRRSKKNAQKMEDEKYSISL